MYNDLSMWKQIKVDLNAAVNLLCVIRNNFIMGARKGCSGCDGGGRLWFQTEIFLMYV